MGFFLIIGFWVVLGWLVLSIVLSFQYCHPISKFYGYFNSKYFKELFIIFFLFFTIPVMGIIYPVWNKLYNNRLKDFN